MSWTTGHTVALTSVLVRLRHGHQWPSTHLPIAVRVSSPAQEGDGPVYNFPCGVPACPCLPSNFFLRVPSQKGEVEETTWPLSVA